MMRTRTNIGDTRLRGVEVAIPDTLPHALLDDGGVHSRGRRKRGD